MSKHDGHKLVYVLDRCTVQIPVTMTLNGDVTHAADAQYEIIDYDGDSGIWCEDCKDSVHGGESGLSEEWQVV
jgi:hypothetical protein